MCLAVPALIKRIEGSLAEVELGGATLTISLALTPEAQVGQYAIIHTGYAIGLLDEAEALETLQLFADMEAAASEADAAEAAGP
ncbi:MAG: HypC/HybG/HupF family hydrogenase formation chaperone [Chloroflexi bacterium]|nr:HypC/HybG/HupF family hydrogenase formation chaperone [Chloroflexota bacterium]